MKPRADLALLMLALHLSGVRVRPSPTDPTRLKHRPEHLPPHLLDGLRRHKADLLALLTAGPADVQPPGRCRWCGRARWWRPAGEAGGWTCGACHPPARPEAAEWARGR
ncbi:MAG: hypothetical protein KJZ54_13425 [Phycisphaerales bacterium]|nr:hypothetical protein [Phycisphaerales bacterium]